MRPGNPVESKDGWIPRMGGSWDSGATRAKAQKSPSQVRPQLSHWFVPRVGNVWLGAPKFCTLYL